MLHVKMGIIGTLCNTATMFQEKQDITEEIDSLKQDLLLSDYPLHFISSTFSPSMEVCHGIQSSKKSGKTNCFCTFTLCRGCLRS
jgi:hypothetical protein